MKKSLIATLVAVPLLSVSAMSFAAEPVALSGAQMDQVTAGTGWSYKTNNTTKTYNFSFKRAQVEQVNISPVTAVQVGVLNFGGGNNYANIVSGNSSTISQ